MIFVIPMTTMKRDGFETMGYIKREVDVRVIIPKFCERCPLYSIECLGTTELYSDDVCYVKHEDCQCSHYSNCRTMLNYLINDEAAMVNLQKEVYKGIV